MNVNKKDIIANFPEVEKISIKSAVHFDKYGLVHDINFIGDWVEGSFRFTDSNGFYYSSKLEDLSEKDLLSLYSTWYNDTLEAFKKEDWICLGSLEEDGGYSAKCKVFISETLTPEILNNFLNNLNRFRELGVSITIDDIDKALFEDGEYFYANVVLVFLSKTYGI